MANNASKLLAITIYLHGRMASNEMRSRELCYLIDFQLSLNKKISKSLGGGELEFDFDD